ncbi:MAG: hypothetical protein HS111_10350 [Kofleriaceae bacterium]|nr:hypothetical protein [Kofleriaceae bacterium]
MNLPRIRPRWLGLLLLAAAVVAVSIAFADDASDREGYIRDIDSKLGSAASELSGVESDSDDGDIRDADRYIEEVRDLVGRLDRVKADDSKAREIVDRYPRHISDYQAASQLLRALKSRQSSAAELVRQCKAFDTSMTERAKAAKDEPRAADELSEFAKSVGRKAEDMMRDAERTRSEIERSREEARRFSASDGRWSSVKDAVQRAAYEMAQVWLRDHEQARRDCEEVLKRERHREIEKRLGELANSRSGRAELRKKIDEMLVLVASKTTDVQGHSSISEINGAVEITKQVDSLLERLRNAQGDDAESKTVASTWPSWNQELRTSLEALMEMKRRQHRTDGGADKCKDVERQLQELIRGYVGEPQRHKEGLSQLPGRARQLGNEWKPKLEAAAQGDREVDGYYTAAKRFGRSDGPWGPIQSRLHASSDKVREHWKTMYNAAVAACTNIWV